MRKHHAASALILFTVAATAGALLMLRTPPVAEARAWVDAMPPHQAAQSDEAQAVFHRCSLAMLQGTCGVMKKSGSSSKPATQVFVAGAGEVDAAVYERLRSQGDEMCGEVLRECRLAWDGTACGIARAMYPELR